MVVLSKGLNFFPVFHLVSRVVGQVAVTGKHLWISADPGFPFEVRNFFFYLFTSFSSTIIFKCYCFSCPCSFPSIHSHIDTSFLLLIHLFQYCDGWQTQFSAGIKVCP